MAFYNTISKEVYFISYNVLENNTLLVTLRTPSPAVYKVRRAPLSRLC